MVTTTSNSRIEPVDREPDACSQCGCSAARRRGSPRSFEPRSNRAHRSSSGANWARELPARRILVASSQVAHRELPHHALVLVALLELRQQRALLRLALRELLDLSLELAEVVAKRHELARVVIGRVDVVGGELDVALASPPSSCCGSRARSPGSRTPAPSARRTHQSDISTAGRRDPRPGCAAARSSPPCPPPMAPRRRTSSSTGPCRWR